MMTKGDIKWIENHTKKTFKEYKVYHPVIKKLYGTDENLPHHVVPAPTIDPYFRVKMQGSIQKYIDSSISSTVNLPNYITIETIADIYMTAYEAGLKGITVYREGSREGILITNKDEQTTGNDKVETIAIKNVFKDYASKISISSTKSMTGHLLGAAGAIEAITSILAINNSIVPPTINHSVYDENIDSKINFTFGKAQKRNVDIALSNTFGFGGHNACVVFSKLD